MKPACTESLRLCVNTHQIFPSQRGGWLFPTLAAFISPKPSPMHKYTSAQDLPVGLWQTPRRSFHEPWHPGEELPVCNALVLPTPVRKKGKNVNLPTGYRRRKIDCLVSRSDGISASRKPSTWDIEMGTGINAQVRKSLYFLFKQSAALIPRTSAKLVRFTVQWNVSFVYCHIQGALFISQNAVKICVISA